MEIFHYHSQTGVFLGSGEADPDPMNDGKWLIPAHATAFRPPEEAPNNIRVFRDGAWGYLAASSPEDDPRPDPLPPTSGDVDAERDRRIASGFNFNGVGYQSRQEDRENIAGAATAALAAMMIGKVAGDFRWNGGEEDFTWIAADNHEIALDAPAMFALGTAAMAHKERHIRAARVLKNLAVIPANYSDDQFWPDIGNAPQAPPDENA